MNKLLISLLLLAPCALANDGGAMRDPTRPLTFSSKKIEGPKLQLQALFQRPSGTVAIINGQSAAVGDMVAGAKIVSITGSGVVYSFQGKQHALRLRPEMPGIKENP